MPYKEELISNKLTVTFDGFVLKPDTPLQLKLNQRYVITLIAEETKSDTASSDVWDVLEDLARTVEAPHSRGDRLPK